MLELAQKPLTDLAAFLRANAVELESLPTHAFGGKTRQSAITYRRWANEVEALVAAEIPMPHPETGEVFTVAQVANVVGAFLEYGEQSKGVSHLGYFSAEGFAGHVLGWHHRQLMVSLSGAQLKIASAA